MGYFTIFLIPFAYLSTLAVSKTLQISKKWSSVCIKYFIFFFFEGSITYPLGFKTDMPYSCKFQFFVQNWFDKKDKKRHKQNISLTVTVLAHVFFQPNLVEERFEKVYLENVRHCFTKRCQKFEWLGNKIRKQSYLLYLYL